MFMSGRYIGQILLKRFVVHKATSPHNSYWPFDSTVHSAPGPIYQTCRSDVNGSHARSELGLATIHFTLISDGIHKYMPMNIR
jgi:hypothetical protein